MDTSTTTFDPGAGASGIARQPQATNALVEPHWITGRLEDRDVRIVEVDVSKAAYEQGHIPGAVLWNAYSDLRRPDYSPVDSEEFAGLLSRSGISPSSAVVFYGYGAFLGFWLMRRHGHNRALLMDGPRQRWEEAGFAWGTESGGATPQTYSLARPDESLIASREAVDAMIGDPGAVIIDVRSEAEYAGERFWPSGATEDTGRSGHIPGAVHVPFELIRDEDGMLRPMDDLEALFAACGVGRERKVVTYCTIGNRASQVWFTLAEVLGYPEASVYYGSWVEWGKAADTPIET